MGQGPKVTLLSNASATGSWKPYQGGPSYLVCTGTIGGATITLETMGQDGSTGIAAATISAGGTKAIDLPPGQYRVSVSGGPPSGLFVDLIRRGSK